jgi:hypothetical protein
MAEENTTAPPPQDFSIVVLGAMNPRIHHPLWYRQHNLISEAESVSAMEADIVVLPHLAQFRTAGITVVCHLERWEIKTSDMAVRPRILQIANDIFDSILPETPVSLFAFNNDFLRKTELQDVKRALGRRAERLEIGISRRLDSANLRLTFMGKDGGASHVRIDPSTTSADDVVIRFNSNHPINAGSGRFNVGPMMAEYYEPDFKEAREFADGVVNALNRSEER